MLDWGGSKMKVVELTDINKVFDAKIHALETDPITKQSQYANEVAKWGIELIEEMRDEIKTYSGDVKVVNRRRLE